MRKPSGTYSEDDLQKAVAEFLGLLYPPGSSMVWHHSPNQMPLRDHGDKKMFGWLSKMRAMGMQDGFPDFVFAWGGTFGGIELKVGTNKQTEKQKAMEAWFRKAGGWYRVCRSVEEVHQFLKELGLKR